MKIFISSSLFLIPIERTMILLFGGLLLFPSISYATSFHVAKTGNDSNSGSKISPFQTIKHGVEHLSPGDTLYVHGGNYSEGISSWKTLIPNGKSWNQPITIAANPGEPVTITPPSGSAFFWIQDGQPKYLIIDGFIIDGQKQALHGFKFSNNSQFIRVQNTEIMNTKSSGILVTICSGCTNPGSSPHETHHEFLKLNIHHNGSGIKDHGFYIETSNNLVEGGQFHNNTGNGGKFFHGNLPGVSNFNIARNNKFFNNSTSGDWSCGLILSSGEGNMAYNNLAYGNFAGFCILHRTTNARLFNNISYENEFYGIYVGIDSTDKTRVENNTVFQNKGYGIFVGDGAQNTSILNNISYQNSEENIKLQKQIGSVTSHNLTSDPLFINAAQKDFQLKPGSPAIDKGEKLNFISDDMVGTARPQGSGYDIGAYEEIQEVDITPPATPREFSAK